LGWQDFFTDEKLQRVIAAALTNNRDLRVAALNVELARAEYGIQRAELLPTVNATGDRIDERLPALLSPIGKTEDYRQYDANHGVASWEIDFFGRIRSLKDQALAEYLATEQARRSAQILLVSSVANAYLALAADRESLTVAENTLAAQRGTYKMVKRRHELGLAADLDVERAQTQVDGARRDIASFHQLIALDFFPPCWTVSFLPGKLAPACLRKCSCAGRMYCKPRICSRRPMPTSARPGRHFSRAFL
jgi:multidrug efflux system outer membrane protein